MRPANIIYGLTDRPPFPIFLLSTAQQTAAAAAISFATLLSVLDAAGVDLETSRNSLSVAMLALGLATILHCIRLGPIGCGYLVPAVFATSYLPGMLVAAKTGGMGLVFGMTIFAGVFQTLVSRIIPRLRPFFPTEITGFVVFTIGLGMGVIGMVYVAGRGLGGNETVVAHGDEIFLASVALLSMTVCSVWLRGTIRTFGVLIGVVVGYVVSIPLGFFNLDALTAVWSDLHLFQPPRLMSQPLSFSWSLALPFMVGALACSLRAIGDVTTAQKINDTQWRRPDLQTIEGGILAGGIGNIIVGLIGSIPCNTASSGVGLSGASGVTSRMVGYGIAGLFAILSFMPILATVLVMMPRPVLGAVMMFTGCMVIMNGLQMMQSRVIDNRKTIVIGVSLVLGISQNIYPNLFIAAPTWLQPFVGSSVVLSILSALLLNSLFRIGMKRSVTLLLRPSPEGAQMVYEFVHRQGGVWGARQDVVSRAEQAMIEWAESADHLVMDGEAMTVEASFDEFNLDFVISYRGGVFEPCYTPPTEEDLLENIDALARLSHLLITRVVDKITVRSDDDRQVVTLHFDH
ncbi:Xanthine permease [Azospirillaceae bacterium]